MMTRKELIDKLESLEREVKEIREYLSQNDGEQVAEVHADLIQVEMLQATVARIVEQYHNGHNLGNRELSCPMVRPLSCHFWGIETIFV